jgi:methylated-DNA-[protein]-cysteine S-methyltransferase
VGNTEGSPLTPLRWDLSYPGGTLGPVERTVLESPIGGVGVEVVDDAVCRVTFAASGAPAAAEPSAVLADTLRQLREYFAGERTGFDLPRIVRQGSEFERAVWAAIADIPYGETTSYGAIAKAVGQPEAAQAVGTACNRNPLPIIVPCHRVIGADGKLVGFGGGLPRKRWLLSLEARIWIEQNLA